CSWLFKLMNAERTGRHLAWLLPHRRAEPIAVAVPPQLDAREPDFDLEAAEFGAPGGGTSTPAAGQRRDDSEAEACAMLRARCPCCSDLREALEDTSHLLLGHAAAAVCHGQGSVRIRTPRPNHHARAGGGVRDHVLEQCRHYPTYVGLHDACRRGFQRQLDLTAMDLEQWQHSREYVIRDSGQIGLYMRTA